MKSDELRVSAPGRICLFGEHQDYFGLSIIAAAINLRITIRGKQNQKRFLRIILPDIQEEEKIFLKKELTYRKERDYLRSTINILQRTGIHIPSGWDIHIKGTIPINSGTSSSSALVVAWIKFLLEAAKDKRANVSKEIAELAFAAEVAEFKEPGGKMDHYASSMGGVINIHFGDKLKVKNLKNPLKEFVLADSLIRKDTTGTLGFIKKNVHQAISVIQKRIKNFDLNFSLGAQEKTEIEKLPPEIKRFLKGTLMTRDLTAEGKKLFESDRFDHRYFGQLLSRQQDVLRDYLHLSVPKIDKMIEASLEAGALGAKINGSGEGGCIFAYTPIKSREVAEALKKCGAVPYLIHVDKGAIKEK